MKTITMTQYKMWARKVMRLCPSIRCIAIDSTGTVHGFINATIKIHAWGSPKQWFCWEYKSKNNKNSCLYNCDGAMLDQFWIKNVDLRKTKITKHSLGIKGACGAKEK